MWRPTEAHVHAAGADCEVLQQTAVPPVCRVCSVGPRSSRPACSSARRRASVGGARQARAASHQRPNPRLALPLLHSSRCPRLRSSASGCRAHPPQHRAHGITSSSSYSRQGRDYGLHQPGSSLEWPGPARLARWAAHPSGWRSTMCLGCGASAPRSCSCRSRPSSRPGNKSSWRHGLQHRRRERNPPLRLRQPWCRTGRQSLVAHP